MAVRPMSRTQLRPPVGNAISPTTKRCRRDGGNVESEKLNDQCRSDIRAKHDGKRRDERHEAFSGE
jgi:hypothetical protein